jgi:hypothetical protein
MPVSCLQLGTLLCIGLGAASVFGCWFEFGTFSTSATAVQLRKSTNIDGATQVFLLQTCNRDGCDGHDSFHQERSRLWEIFGLVVTGTVLNTMALVLALWLGLHIGGKGALVGAYLLFTASLMFGVAIALGVLWRDVMDADFAQGWICCLTAAIFDLVTAFVLLKMTVGCER